MLDKIQKGKVMFGSWRVRNGAVRRHPVLMEWQMLRRGIYPHQRRGIYPHQQRGTPSSDLLAIWVLPPIGLMFWDWTLRLRFGSNNIHRSPKKNARTYDIHVPVQKKFCIPNIVCQTFVICVLLPPSNNISNVFLLESSHDIKTHTFFFDKLFT